MTCCILVPWQRSQHGTHSARGLCGPLNQLAAALAIQLLQDLVLERVQTSRWVHLTVDPHGRVQVQYPAPMPAGAKPCRLCASTGLGDARMG